jgi:HlyD family secretion protein
MWIVRLALRRPYSFTVMAILIVLGTGNSGTPLFNLVQSDVLRVYVFTPQENAPSIHEGLAAKILLEEPRSGIRRQGHPHSGRA